MATRPTPHDAEIEAKLCEVVDALLRPASEFTPRVRLILTELVFAVTEDEPTNPRMRLALPPPPPPTPRQPQKTMEIRVEDILK